MRKIQIFGALLAVCAIGAVAATSAFATDEFLVGNKLVALGAKIPAVIIGTWLLLALGFGGSSVMHFVCDGELLGTINGLNASGRGTDTVTEIHNLGLTELKTILCPVLHAELGICSGNLDPRVTMLNLPWLTELLLHTGDATPRDMFSSSVAGKEVGFSLECETSLKTKFTETCEGNFESSQLKNEANGTLRGSIPLSLSTKCAGGNVAHTEAEGAIKTENGETLSVS